VTPQRAQRRTRTRKSRARPDDRGQVDDRGLVAEFAAAVGASGLDDRDVDRRLGVGFGGGGVAAFEEPLLWLASRRFGDLEAGSLGEGSSLALAAAFECFDLGQEFQSLSGNVSIG
jgi:hypothetical protein